MIATVRSPYSTIEVLERGRVRTLAFVQDGGTRWPQTVLDLDRPHEPAMPYLRGMALSLAYVPKARAALVVGLGGGAAVHLLRRLAPGVRIVGIEIDPAVVRLARAYFALPDDADIQVVVGDALDVVPTSQDRFDLVWMDVFLDPSAPGTNASGIPRGTTTEAFLRTLAARVRRGGVAVFNLHHKSGFSAHLAAIERAFGHVHVYAVPGTGHRIVVAATEPLPGPAALARRARRIDERTARGTPPSSLRLAPLLRHRLPTGDDPNRAPDPRIRRP